MHNAHFKCCVYISKCTYVTLLKWCFSFENGVLSRLVASEKKRLWWVSVAASIQPAGVFWSIRIPALQRLPFAHPLASGRCRMFVGWLWFVGCKKLDPSQCLPLP